MKLFHRFFLILLGFAMVPVASLGLWVMSMRGEIRDNARDLHGRLAALVAESVDRTLEQMNRTLSVVQDLEFANGQEKIETPALRRAAVNDPDVALISILDPRGVEIQRMADPELFPGGFEDRSRDPVLAESRKLGHLVVGQPIGKPDRVLVPIVHPLSGGRDLFVLYSMRGLKRKLERMSKSGRARILLVDPAGKAVGGLGDPPPSADFVLPPGGRESWWDDIPSPDGPWVAAAAPVPSLSWRAVSLQSRREAYAETDRSAERAALFFIVLTVLVAAGAFVLSGRLLKPITLLIGGADRVSRGDFTRPVPRLGWGELDDLAKTFNAMADKVGHYQALQVEKILEEKAKVDALVRNIPEGVLLAGFDGSIAFANATASRILGAGAASARMSTLKSPQIEKLVETVRRGAKHADGVVLEVVAPDGEGTAVFACQALTVVREGKDVGILVLLRDVTAERELEKMKDEFFHAVVHDLRGPITVIDGVVHMMKAMKNLGDREKKYVDMAAQASDKLSGLIANILDIAKLESGTLKLNLVRFRSEALIGAVVDLYRIPAEGKGVSVEAEPATAGEALGDQKLLDRVLMNLAGNALKFTPPGGKITLGAVAVGAELECFVRDTGPGIPTDKIDAVFEKFKQLDRDAAARSGYGLGLSICKKIVEVHGGRIWVESKEGQGSRFAFRIPRAGPPAALPAPAAAGPGVSPRAG